MFKKCFPFEISGRGGFMKRISAFLAVFFAFCAGAGADSHIFDEFTFAVFDRGGFYSHADGEKITGAFSDNFVNSSGVMFFIDSCYDDEDTCLRGEADLSIFCSYDYARIAGESHNRMRYGIDTGLLFMNASFSQVYDFDDNKIDFIGGIGFRIGAWLGEYAGLDFSAGIDRWFVAKENFIRINAGLIFVPFGTRSSRPSEKKDFDAEDRALLAEAKAAEGTKKLEEFCIHMYSGSGYHAASLRNEGIAEIAFRKLGTEKDNLVIANPSDIANPFAVDGEKIIYLTSFSVALYDEDGILCETAGAKSEIPFVVRYNDEVKNAKSFSRAFLKPQGTKTIIYDGSSRVVPVFDCAYFF